MTVLRQILGKRSYQIVLTILSLAVLLYQAETGPLFEQTVGTTQSGGLSSVTNEATVARVIDGDTFELSDGERVRLIGIDSPESVKSGTGVECFGRESSEFLREFIEGKNVRLESDRTDRDRYGRLLRYVYLGEVFVNEQIVQGGYAESTVYRPDIRFQAVFDEAERQAKQERKGMWMAGACQE